MNQSIRWELISGLLVGAGNENTAESSYLLSGTMKSLFDANCSQSCAHETYFNLQHYLKMAGASSWCRNSY
jgi:hypothetical protein